MKNKKDINISDVVDILKIKEKQLLDIMYNKDVDNFNKREIFELVGYITALKEFIGYNWNYKINRIYTYERV